MFDLQTLSGIEPSRYADALETLLSAGYITISGTGPNQAIQLTPTGTEVIKLARPA